MIIHKYKNIIIYKNLKIYIMGGGYVPVYTDSFSSR